MTVRCPSAPEHEALDPDCISRAEAIELLSRAPWQSLVVVGDSVAAGVRQPLEGYLGRRAHRGRSRRTRDRAARLPTQPRCQSQREDLHA
jgi:hypothetical protein